MQQLYFLHRLEVPPWHLFFSSLKQEVPHAGRHRKQNSHTGG